MSNLCHYRIVFLKAFTLAVIGVFLATPASSYGQDSQDSPVIEISRGRWYYRWGDSPVDKQGVPIWTYEDISGSEWQPVESSSDVKPLQKESQILWLFTQLPEGNWQRPTLLISHVLRNFEVYLNQQRIYQFEQLKPSRNRWHNIPIEDTFEGKALFLKVHPSNLESVGRYNKIWLGSQAQIFDLVIKYGMEFFILGFLSFCAGFFSIFIYFRRRRQKPYFTLAFGAFAICIGISYFAISKITQFFIPESVRNFLGVGAFFLFPIGLYAFIEQIYGCGYKRLIRRLWQLHTVAAVIAFGLDITNVFPLLYAVSFLFILLTIDMFILIPMLTKAALTGNVEARILNVGLIIMFLTGLHDILMGFNIIPYWYELFIWGVFVFILFLVYLVEYRFAQAGKSLENYSTELEAKSEELEISHEKLEEYSQTLEQKVEERTYELREKNEALEGTLVELGAAQHQLIMQEKMASLGNLVAGVAHEMNNPIGAIHSSADVATRGIRKIRGFLQNKHGSDRPDNDNSQLERSLKLLRDNNQVIITASDRVAQIVQSLKAFAKLDEATFQKIDLHENIDTTLTLIHHELKDKVTIIKKYGDIPYIQCYPSELNQVWMNLLRNAIQAIEDRGTIKIATSADETQVFVRISDTGKGIPPENVEKIFDPGFTTKGVGVGPGLGLSTVYNIIQKHNGDIKVESEVGKGTKFTISLPIEQNH